MKLIYIAGPYRADTTEGVRRNIARARKVAEHLWKAHPGNAVLCPHSNSGMMDGVVPDEQFLQGAIEMLKGCDAIATVTGWEKSEGSVEEVYVADEKGIEYLGDFDPDTL